MIKLNFKIIISVFCGLFLFCTSLRVITNPSVLASGDSVGSFPIIMYHHISADESKKGDYVITPNQFEADLKYLKEHGYQSITVRELYAIDNGERNLRPNSIMITFDDGQESFFVYAFPLLQKYGFSAVFSPIGKYTEMFSNSDDHNIEYSHITWDQMRKLANSGIVEFGNHSYDMHYSNSKGRKGVTQNKNESFEDYRKALLEDINEYNTLFYKHMDFTPTIYTYPFGKFSDNTETIIKEAGFTAAFTCYEKRTVPKENDNWLFNLGRFNRSGKKSTENFFKSISVH